MKTELNLKKDVTFPTEKLHIRKKTEIYSCRFYLAMFYTNKQKQQQQFHGYINNVTHQTAPLKCF